MKFRNWGHLGQFVSVLIIGFLVLFSFQNCSPGSSMSTTDQTPLAVPLIVVQPVAALTNSSTVTVQFDINGVPANSIKTVTCQLNAQASQDCSLREITLSSLADGDHTLSIKVETTSGIKALSTQVFRKDSTLPLVAVSGLPMSITNQNSANFLFTATDNLSGVDKIECSIDGAIFAACVSPKILTGLTAAAHSFKIRAIDKAGNMSSEYSYPWTVDLNQPTVSITTSPAAAVNVTSANFIFSGAGVISYECQLDSAGFSSCASPKAFLGLSAGAHTLLVRGTNAAGTVSDAVVSSWVVDTTSPLLSVSSFPPTVTNQNTASFAFSASDNLSGILRIDCSIDSAAYTACTSPKSLTGLSSAAHNFKIRAIDKAGNPSTEYSYSWTVDLSQPMVTISSFPAASTNSLIASFSFSGPGLVSYECRLDGASFVACSSPKSHVVVAGNHTFQVRGTNSAGTVSAATSYVWVVDTVVPTVSVTGFPLAATNQGSASFLFSGVDNSSGIDRFECSLDSATYAACSSPKNLTGLSSASHNFKIQAIDKAGNTSAEYSYSWNVDLNQPTVTIASQPAAISNSSNASFNFSGTGASNYECQLDTSGFSTCASPKTYSVGAGTHNFQVRSINSVGTSSAIASFSWVVDLVAPTAPVITPNVGVYSNQKNATILFSSTDVGTGIARYECATGAGAQNFATCTSPLALTNLPEGVNRAYVQAIDAANNISSVTSFFWNIDSIVPSTPTLANSEPAYSKLQTATITFSATDSGSGIASYICTIDATVVNPCISPKLFSGLADGSHSVNVVAIDGANNQSASASNSWNVDTQKPVITITARPADPNTLSTATFSWTISDASPLQSQKCSLDGVAATDCSLSRTLTNVSSGTHNFVITAIDRVGNSEAATSTWVQSNPAGPGSQFIGYSDVPPRAFRSLVSAANEKVAVSSACGQFESVDNGASFNPIKLPTADSNSIAHKAYFRDGNNVYIGTFEGLSKSTDGGLTYQTILDLAKAKSVISSNPNPCTSIGLNYGMQIWSVWASGNTIAVGSSGGLMISKDGGVTFRTPPITTSGYYVPIISFISDVKGSGEVIFATASLASGRADQFNTKRPDDPSCAINTTLQDYGLIVSRDGGLTFSAVTLPNPLVGGAVIEYQPPNVYVLGATQNEVQGGGSEFGKGSFLVSHDNGASFSRTQVKAYISNLGQVYYKSYTISASPRKIYYTQYFEGIAVPSSYSSSDGGATFSPLVVDAGRPNMPVFAIASSQRRLYASTDQGLYISDNEGASFTTRKNWSSPNCTYPWWNLAGYANLQVSASGNSILAGILPNGDLPLSIDNGQTFSFSRQVTLPAEFRNRKIFLDGPDVVFMGAELSGAKRIGFSKSTNGGVSWSDFAPSYNMTGTSKILYPLDKKPLNLDGGLYTAADGINLLGWVSAANLPDVLSAYSSDNRLITTNHNGYNIYENGSLKRAISSLEASSNATEFGSSQIIDLPSGPFYLGKRVFANDPGNPNFFKQVLTAPSMPMTIFENSTGIYVVTGLGGYYLYRSVDGGKTFAPVIGALN